MGSMRDDAMTVWNAAQLDEEPEKSDIAEEELSEQIGIEDDIIYDEDIEHLHMDRDQNYNDRVVNFRDSTIKCDNKDAIHGAEQVNTLKNINNQFINNTSKKETSPNKNKKDEDYKLTQRSKSPTNKTIKDKSIFDKDHPSDVNSKNSFYRLSSKRVMDKKNTNLDQWQVKADHKIIFKVDESYTLLIAELLNAGWVKSEHTGIYGADFIYGKDTFNIEYYNSLRPDQYIGQFRDNLVTRPKGLLT